jgi:hypothetical protein
VTTHVLLLLPDTALVPRLSVLSSASKVRDSQDASIGRDPGHPGGGEPRSKVDVEATVSVKQSRSRSIELDVLVSSDGHGDLGTILRGVEDLATMKKMSRDVSVRSHRYKREDRPTRLLRNEVRRLEVHLRLPKQFELASRFRFRLGKVKGEDGPGIGVRC